ncbi:MAG: acyltransferase family protein [Nevskia sp.]|nr:acyltransferase family protein [Nevskia sp.]
MNRTSLPRQRLLREAAACATPAIGEHLRTAQTKSVATNRIEGLDGLRALSIVIVLIGHSGRVAGHPEWLSGLRTVGVIGVELFFAISGFIITYLMVRERQRSGRLSLRHFWARRALRILPPLAVMMAGFATASAAGLFSWSWPSFWGAATFTRDLAIPGWFGGSDWFFGHTWSLSMEEQFYAVWPLLFVAFFARRDLARGLLVVIAAAPVIALICEFSWAPVRNLLPYLPYLAAGCLLALLIQRGNSTLLARLEALPYRGRLLALLALLACVVAWLRNEHWTPWLWVPLDAILMPATVFLLLAETVQHHDRWTRLLSSTPLRVLGLWSYSVYLWQQLFSGPEEVYLRPWLWSTWPFNLVAALVCGALSYALIERGSGRIKSALKLG